MFSQLNALKTTILKAKANHSEFEQSLIRTVFVSFILLYLLMSGSSTKPILICSIYLAASVLMMSLIILKPAKNEKRQWVSMLLDVGATSYEMLITDAMGGVFIGVYLWLIIGYGLRYGSKFFKGTYVVSLIGFNFSLFYNPYWVSHSHLAYGFLITLILIPLHTLRLQLRLENAIKEADTASKAKTQFLSHMSHEMRTPLNGIIGATDLLRNTHLNVKQQEYSNMVHGSSIILRKLINDILDISKIEQGKVDLDLVAFDLHDLAQNIQSVFALEAKRKGINLVVQVDEGLRKSLIGSRIHIVQVLMNLVGNAIKFTHAGSVHLQIVCAGHFPSMHHVQITVKDSGIGIKPEALNRIFDSFTQADNTITRQYGGSGLGTTISKQLVELMGGRISVDSIEGVGTTFRVALPLAKDLSETMATKVTEVNNVVKLAEHAKFNKKLRVLVADDNAVNRMILTEVLLKNNCSVQAVENGDAALDYLEMHEFDLMILDFNMPNINGLEVYQLHHALAGSKPTKTVILTADATPETREKCIASGVYSVLTKPILTEQIIQLVADISGQTLTVKPAKTKGKLKAVSSKHAIATTPAMLVDVDRISHLSKLGSSPAFIGNLIQQFIEASDANIEQLATMCKSMDIAGILQNTHSLIGESANIGLEALSKQSEQLAHAAEHHAQKIQTSYSKLEATYKSTRIQLLNLLAESSYQTPN